MLLPLTWKILKILKILRLYRAKKIICRVDQSDLFVETNKIADLIADLDLI